ncbi:MAG: hypothetical protein FJ161_00010 [Gammaproteobacteria bacterium]|nr:hypothetical protein [Gammaproteobacteria bacterium]
MLTLTLEVFGQKHYLNISDDPKGIGALSCQFVEDAAKEITQWPQRDRMYIHLALHAAMQFYQSLNASEDRARQLDLHITKLCGMIDQNLEYSRTVLDQ